MLQIEITAQAGVSLENPGEESPKRSPESRRQKLPRGERQTSQSVCLFTGERQQKHPATPHRHMGARLPQTHA